MSKWLENQRTQGVRCRYCGTNKQLTKDHIVPLSKGGKDCKSNYQVLCKYCNNKKGSLIEREIVAIFRDIKSKGFCYKWQKPYGNWLDYIIIKRQEYGLEPLNW